MRTSSPVRSATTSAGRRLPGWRFFAHHAGQILLSPRWQGNDLPALGFQAFEVLMHSGKDDIHIVVALPRVLGAVAMDFGDDFVLNHGSGVHEVGVQMSGHSR